MNSVINFLDSGDVLGKRGLVDNDNKSLQSKHPDDKISNTGYRNRLAKNKGYKNSSEYQSELAKNRGYKSHSEYLDMLAKKRGYKSHSEYCSEIKYENGECVPFSKNKECPLYLGVHIAERILPLIFDNVERMPYGNRGYDFICINGYKIDVKSSSLRSNNLWMFGIRKNKIADYFLMIAFDNRYDLNVMNIWLVKNNKIIRGGKLNERVGFGIMNNKKSLRKLKEYEITDKLDNIQKVCNEFREAN